MAPPSQESLRVVLADLDAWPKLLGYEVPEGASLEDKVRLHHERMLELRSQSTRQVEAVAEFAGMIADVLQHVNEKTEARVIEHQQALARLDDAMGEHGVPEALHGAARQLIGEMQFQDIQRQELQSVEDALRGLKGCLADCLAEADVADSDVLEQLPETLSRMLPRTDIDALEITPEQAGPKVELF